MTKSNRGAWLLFFAAIAFAAWLFWSAHQIDHIPVVVPTETPSR